MRIEIPERKKLVHEMRFAVRWGEMDAMGHVNNTVYFRYLENARIAWMEAIGCHPDPRGEGLVIVNAFCNFYRQLEFPAEVLLKLYVSDPGRTTFDLGHHGAAGPAWRNLRRGWGHHDLGRFPTAKGQDAARLDAGPGNDGLKFE